MHVLLGPQHKAAGQNDQRCAGAHGGGKLAQRNSEGVQVQDTAAAQGAGQAIAALVSLGYSQSEAALAVSKIDGTLPVEEIIKLALRSMAGRR